MTQSEGFDSTADLNLLLVDDDPNDVVLFATALDGSGWNVRLQTAGGSRQAIEYLERHCKHLNGSKRPLPDLIVLDLRMPGRDGFDFLAWRRSSPALSLLPVILFSGATEQSQIDLARKLGANEYIPKPHRFEDLKRVIQRICRIGMSQRLHCGPVQRRCAQEMAS